MTQSLSERLREDFHTHDSLWAVMREAADALDAKDVEIAKLKTEGDRLSLLMMNAYCDADQKDAEIELMKEGRKLHDELTDHLEAELRRAREALGAHRASAGEEQS